MTVKDVVKIDADKRLGVSDVGWAPVTDEAATPPLKDQDHQGEGCVPKHVDGEQEEGNASDERKVATAPETMQREDIAGN